MRNKTLSKWPKTPIQLTESQKQISDDWLKYWLSLMPKRFGLYARFNHEYVVKNAPSVFISTLEIGCGDGEHLEFEKLNSEQRRNYVAVDIRKNVVDVFKSKHPDINCYVSDCQKKQKFSDNSFDRVLAIHVLEHIPNLPAALKELHRLCNKERGVLSVVLPCEGSLAYWIARKISAERMFKKRYKMPYDWYMKSEHINSIPEVIEELEKYFDIVKSSYFPLKIRVFNFNLAIGYTLVPKV